MVTRGQAYTLEGVLAAILIVTATVYGLQAIDTRAWQDSTQRQTDALGYRASDMLTVASESDALRNATLCYRDGRPLNGNRAQPRSDFEWMLNTTFDSQGDQYNIEFSFRNRNDETETILVSEQTDEGVNRPPPSAATASTTVTLTDGMHRRIDGGCNAIPVEIDGDRNFYAPDVSPSELYNIVEVRLIVW
ncbi:DUF7288 family protein [Haloarcula onubensis]|uniref:Flagellin n=1 Tax=Haloarcula onubensis TaxID=2950539 RepID=A0ABU2FQE5_9EURY|nr:hypothetical protein [Halomicroarcula sp. S3CR25-11]MDS0282976.1 hypothetical protein [Halomicroarcula sp. S3CR25-11]